MFILEIANGSLKRYLHKITIKPGLFIDEKQFNRQQTPVLAFKLSTPKTRFATAKITNYATHERSYDITPKT